MSSNHSLGSNNASNKVGTSVSSKVFSGFKHSVFAGCCQTLFSLFPTAATYRFCICFSDMPSRKVATFSN